jgi:rod shape determining protein RodA
VPERHTDFIFCTICEEFGLMGAGVLFVLYALFILKLMRMGDNQQESFGRVYCYSAASMLTYHVAVNIGFTMGFMPVMGITLPLISYGGSSLLATTIMVFIAVALDASTRRALPVYRKW